jgi:ribosomal-protein-alanine N-acetyltransferase
MGEAGTIIIDRLRQEDVEQVLAIEQASFSMPWSRNLFLSEFRNSNVSLMLAARSPEGRVIGYIVCWIVADEMHILDLATLPALRRRGIARRLVLAAVRQGADRGVARAFLEVRASNRAALSLYERLGFTRSAVREGYYDQPLEDAVVMELDRTGLQALAAGAQLRQ